MIEFLNSIIIKIDKDGNIICDKCKTNFNNINKELSQLKADKKFLEEKQQ